MTIQTTVEILGKQPVTNVEFVVKKVEVQHIANYYADPTNSGGIQSVNSKTGPNVSLTAADIPETSVLKWLTSALKNAYDGAVSAIANMYTKSEVNTLLSNKADLVNGYIPASQLPSYVDDVLEYSDLASFPATGANGKIYIALDTNKTYRWTGSTYASLDEGVVLGETSSTAGRGDWVKDAYDWIVANGSNILNHLSNTVNPHSTTAAQVGAYTTGQIDTFLGAKQNTLIVASNFTNASPLSGTTNETILYALEIPANTFGVGRDPKIFSLCTKTGTSTYATGRIKVNTTASLSGAITLGTMIPASGGVVWLPFERRAIHIDSAGSTLVASASSAMHTDIASSSSAFNSVAPDWTVKQYIMLTEQLQSGATADSLQGHYFYVTY